ncbi:hypothetical protein C0J52_03897 [Blattella germanica]|nr:hypothetical protein C0J52_03897 [Blattella germanica]
MAFLLQPDIVRYNCTCGSLKPISRIYFCRHCLKIRCGYCVCHEADSHYCANCLENLPSAEARLKKNRCAACLDCPSCLNTVSTRTTSIVTPNPDDPNKSITRKAYYLACGFCRWTSRDVGLPDQTVEKYVMSFDKYKEYIEQGDTAILYLSVNSMHAIQVEPKIKNKKGEFVENVFQTTYGALKVQSLIGKKYGTKIALSRGWAYVLHPTPELWTLTLPHRTQIIYTPDISMIIFQLEIKPGSIVVESGTGSGSLSHALIRCIKPSGHLYTFDFHEYRVSVAREEFESHGVGQFVTVKQRDVCQDGFGSDLNGKADAIFLDLPHPWEAVPHAVVSLKNTGGRFGSFSPCIEQVQQTCEVLTQHGFVEIATIECLQKELQVQTRTMSIMDFDFLKEKKSESEVKIDSGSSETERAAWKSNKNKEHSRVLTGMPPQNLTGHTGYLTTATLPPIWAPTGGWPERENVHAARISSLLEHYKALALRERQEKDRKKFTPRRSYLHFSDKFGLTAMVARKRAGLPPLGGVGLKDDTGLIPELLLAEAQEEVEQLPEDIYTKPINLAQGHSDVAVVNIMSASQNLILDLSSLRFNWQHKVRIVTCEPLRIEEESHLIIKLCNPTQHQTTINFLPLPTPEEDSQEREREIEEKKKKHAEKKEAEKNSQGRDDVSILLPSLSRQMSISEDPRTVNVKVTGNVNLPPSSIVLPPRDDAAEYDDSGDTFHFQDDPKIVVWRKANKAAVKMAVIPQKSASDNGEVLIGFVMQYSYINTMATLEQKEPQKVDLKVKVFLNIGKVVGNCQ